MSTTLSSNAELATLADVPGIVSVFFDAFGGESSENMFPSTPEGRAWLAGAYENFIRRQESHVFVVKDDDGSVVGNLLCWVDAPGMKGVKAWRERYPAIGVGQSDEALDGFFGSMAEQHYSVMRDEPHIFVESIAVLKSKRRRGFATRLLEAAARLADQLGYPSYLDATELAVPLYARADFIKHSACRVTKSMPMRRPGSSEKDAGKDHAEGHAEGE